MRVPGALFALTICMFGGAAAGAESSHGGNGTSGVNPSPRCHRTQSYLAVERVPNPGQRLAPRKLTELPPATAYMAVMREIGGCDAPLTMAKYRRAGRP